MITYRIDKEKNILFVYMVGVVPREKMPDALCEFTQKCAQMKEHFTIINDVTLFKTDVEQDFQILGKVTSLMREKFMIDKVIRIIGPNNGNVKSLMKADEKLGLDNILYAQTRQEALKMYDTCMLTASNENKATVVEVSL